MPFAIPKPTLLLLGGLFIGLIQGCSTVPLQSDDLLVSIHSEFKQPRELTAVQFNAQREYQCGPAALATILQWQGVDVSSDELVPKVYLPDKKGSLQLELIAAIRQYGLVPYIIEQRVDVLLKEINAGNPVLVLQNLGLEWAPKWHYAVVVGYDIKKNEIILRSGEIYRHVNSFELFERTWRRAKYWGIVAIKNDRLPATANPFAYLKSIAPFEELKKTGFAITAYKTALKKWPDNEHLLMAAGNASYSIKDIISAEKYYRKVIKLSPDYAPALNNLAQILLEQKKYMAAEKLVLKAIKQGGRYKSMYENTLKTIRREK